MKDKVILVTGGGQGLGAAICRTLAAEGATIAVADIKQENAARMADEIRSGGNRAFSYAIDVSKPESIQLAIEEIIYEHKKLDVVINNAGIDVTKSIDELAYEEFQKVIDVNLVGPFNVAKAAFPHLKNSGKGHIVNIVSTAAKRAWPNASAYHASKWGLLGLSHALHVEARKDKIKVTALLAGGMQTPFILERFPEVDPNVLQDPRNVADTIKYVLSQPEHTVIPEVMVIPMTETSWP